MNTRTLIWSAIAVLSTAPAFAADWPSGFSKCADQGGICKVGSSSRQVSFGIKNKFVVKALKGDVACTIETFGSNPYPGVAKKCAVGAPAPAPAPAPSPAPAASITWHDPAAMTGAPPSARPS